MKTILPASTTVFCLLVAAVLSAQPGTLDETFGNGGFTTTNLDTFSNDFSNAMAIQNDGKILLTGRSNNAVTLVRYTTAGTLDETFGTAGVVSTDLGTISDGAQAIALQNDGKIVVAGKTSSDIALIRYLTDGSLDTTFGSAGIMIHDLGSAADESESLFIQSDGKLVVSGNTNAAIALARFNADGTPDNDFGTAGIVIADLVAGFETGYSTVPYTDDKVLVAGKSNQDIVLLRFNSDGTPDDSFGTNGVVTTDIDNDSSDEGHAVVVQNDGKIVVAGRSDLNIFEDFVLVRYHVDGSVDETFGDNGVAVTDIASESSDFVTSMVQQPNGQLVVVGLSRFGMLGTTDDFSMVRYNADGTVDNEFGTAGIVTTSLDSGHDDPMSVAIQPDQKIVVAGYSFQSTLFSYGFAVARYNGDSSVNIREGQSGVKTRLFPNPTTGVITISNDQSWIDKAEVFNVLGEMIFSDHNQSGSSITIDLSHIPEGAYFVRIFGGEILVVTHKVIVRH